MRTYSSISASDDHDLACQVRHILRRKLGLRGPGISEHFKLISERHGEGLRRASGLPSTLGLVYTVGILGLADITSLLAQRWPIEP